MLDQASESLSPLPPNLKHGLVAVTTFGFLSFFLSTSLFLLLTFRLIKWRWQTRSQEPTNQFLILIYNLLLADIQQSLAFLLNASALQHDAIEVGTSICWAQGWFVSTGDLASSLFILAIALHTFLAIVKQYKLPSVAFYSVIAGLWTFDYVMGIIGAGMHPGDIYVRASAWCWINENYEDLRLVLHYLWIFVCMFTTILTYLAIFFTLRLRNTPTSQVSIPHGTTPLMLLYPLIYTVCTIPLAAGRIASMAGRNVDLTYFCVAGAMIASNGWLDVILYSLTRRGIVFSDVKPGDDIGLDTFAFLPAKLRMGTVTTIEANPSAAPRRSNSRNGGGILGRPRRLESSSSTENLYDMHARHGHGHGHGIKTERTVQVRVTDENKDHSDIFELHQPSHGSSSVGLDKKVSWETNETHI